METEASEPAVLEPEPALQPIETPVTSVTATPVTCGWLSPGSMVRLAATFHAFVCDVDGVLHWVGDARALEQQVQRGLAVDLSAVGVVDLASLSVLPRGAPWLSAGLIKVGEPIGVVTWDVDAEPSVQAFQCVDDLELIGISRRQLLRVGLRRGGVDANVRAPRASAQPWGTVATLTGCSEAASTSAAPAGSPARG